MAKHTQMQLLILNAIEATNGSYAKGNYIPCVVAICLCMRYVCARGMSLGGCFVVVANGCVWHTHTHNHMSMNILSFSKSAMVASCARS